MKGPEIPEHDVISQGELAAWADKEAELRDAVKVLQGELAAIKARIDAGATVQHGFYRVVARRMMGCPMDSAVIIDRTCEPGPGWEYVNLGTRKARKKGA